METTEIVAQPVTEQQPEPEESVHLVARNPQEMALAKSNLEQWLEAKVKSCSQETDELGAALDKAARNKWATDTLRRHVNLAAKREQFYEKALQAVKAGYTLVPNFPVDIFAMRVKRAAPSRHTDTSNYSTPSVSVPAPTALPAGEGRYVAGDRAKRISGSYDEPAKDGKTIKKYFSTTAGYSDVEFPIMAAQAEVMTATQEAMTLRVFDTIGICPPQRKGDPLIIGQIRMPKVGWQEPKMLSFLIAWHLDLRTL